MSIEIKKILDDIYMIDPSLKDKESDLIRIIEELNKRKPVLAVDQAFIKSLREKIMNEANVPTLPQEAKSSFFSLAHLAFAGVGAAVMLLIVLPFLLPETQKAEVAKKTGNTGSGQIVPLGERAFGALTTAINAANTEQGEAKLSSALGSASAPAPDAQVSSRTMGMGGGGATATVMGDADAKMIMPPAFSQYEYKYTGEPLVLEAGESQVYKRTRSDGFEVAADGLMGANLGVFDLGKLANPKLQNFSIMEDSDFGMQVSVNSVDGVIDIFQNWQRWQEHYPVCSDDACWEQNRIKIGDVPADEEVKALADAFITQYGLSLEGYGPGEIRDFWRRQYEAAADKNSVYIPEEVQVVYPMLVNGETVYDSGGFPFGLSVNVNIKFMKVSGLYGLRANAFESSAYTIETDANRILKLAERGGQYPVYYAREEAGTADKLVVELQTPKQVLMSYWHYDEAKKESYELFVPALVFPVKMPEKASEFFYQENIVIPLVAEILDTFEQIPGDMVPMPMVKEGGAADLLPTDQGALVEESVEPAVVPNRMIKE
jgi:hypothetical protein